MTLAQEIKYVREQIAALQAELELLEAAQENSET